MEATTLVDFFADVLGEAKDDRVKNIVSDSQRRLTHWLLRLRRLQPRQFATKKKRVGHLKPHSRSEGKALNNTMADTLEEAKVKKLLDT